MDSGKINPMWKQTLALPTLQPGQIHVWRLATSDFRGCEDRLAQFLSLEEQQRVARFIFDHHRHAYLVTHGVMRRLLGHYLGLEPEQVMLMLNPCGKPSVDFTRTPATVNTFQFNISESRGMALLAFGLCGELGVDVEAWRQELDVRRMAGRFFAAGEKKSLLALPASVQRAAFFYGWTRKEAYMKARGLGFTLPLASFEVSLDPGGEPRLLSSQEADVRVDEWQMFSLEPGEGFAGALAVHGPAQVTPLAFTSPLLFAGK